ncbi:MAG: hypothetical protein ABWY93_21055 [Mycobacterium sp.]
MLSGLRDGRVFNKGSDGDEHSGYLKSLYDANAWTGPAANICVEIAAGAECGVGLASEISSIAV